MVSAVGAVATGLQAAERIGHDSPGHYLVHVHRNFIIAATALAGLTASLAWVWRSSRERPKRLALLAGLAVTVAVCTLGADRGALLVYTHGIGVNVEHHEHPISEPDNARPDSGDHVH